MNEKIGYVIDKRGFDIIALISSIAIIPIGYFLVKVYIYTHKLGLFWFHNISYKYLQVDNNEIFQFVFFLLIFSIILAIGWLWTLFSEIEKKEKIKYIIVLDLLISLILFFLVYNDLRINSIIVNYIITILMVIFFQTKVLKCTKNFIKDNYSGIKKWEMKKLLNESAILLSVFIIVIPLVAISFGIIECLINNKYNIIDNNKVVLYSTTDYAIVKDCKIDYNKGKLEIKSGAYKIDLTNIKEKTILIK